MHFHIVSSNTRTLLQKTLNAENQICNELKRRIVAAAACLERGTRKTAQIQVLGAVKKLMKHLGKPGNEFIYAGVVQGIGVHLKASQTLLLSHASDLIRIMEDSVIELRDLGILLDNSTDMKAYQLLQHNIVVMQKRSMLQALQESIISDEGPDRVVMRTGKPEAHRNNGNVMLLLRDVYQSFSLRLHLLVRKAFMSP